MDQMGSDYIEKEIKKIVNLNENVPIWYYINCNIK